MQFPHEGSAHNITYQQLAVRWFNDPDSYRDSGESNIGFQIIPIAILNGKSTALLLAATLKQPCDYDRNKDNQILKSMCVLRVYSDKDSFKSFEKTTKIPVYGSYEKGELNVRRQVMTDYKILFDVSEKEWDDFQGQVKDTIFFLKQHFDELDKLFQTHSITHAYLDFPLYTRLNEGNLIQIDHLPRELIQLAGKLSLGIDMAIYSKDAFSRYEE
jgi:hypothetical protein